MSGTQEKSCVSCASVLLMLTSNEEEESVRVKRGKTRKWIKRREEKGYFNNIVEELRVEDTASYQEMTRKDYETFQDILTVTGRIFEPTGRLRPPADRKTLMQLTSVGQTRENSHRLSREI